MERVVAWGGRKFRRYCCTVFSSERIVWAVSSRQAMRMVERYTGAHPEHITARRSPIELDLTPPTYRERKNLRGEKVLRALFEGVSISRPAQI